MELPAGLIAAHPSRGAPPRDAPELAWEWPLLAGTWSRRRRGSVNLDARPTSRLVSPGRPRPVQATRTRGPRPGTMSTAPGWGRHRTAPPRGCGRPGGHPFRPTPRAWPMGKSSRAFRVVRPRLQPVQDRPVPDGQSLLAVPHVRRDRDRTVERDDHGEAAFPWRCPGGFQGRSRCLSDPRPGRGPR